MSISEVMVATSSSNSLAHKKRTATTRKRKSKPPQTLQELVSKSTIPNNKNNNALLSLNTTKQLKQAKRISRNEEEENMMLVLQTNNINTINSDVTYNANAIGQGNVKRIRTPAPHDVLSGRGGSVNAHPGNCQFRDWVHVRKEEYNLARSKQAKADICREIIGKVLAIGGRFLTKENQSSQWWVEQDDEKMMSKTSQALREGAPKIREAHREELGLKPGAPTSRRKSTLQHSQPSKRPINTASESVVNKYNSNAKRVRVDYNGQTVFPNQSVTPPLSSMTAPSTVTSNADLQNFSLSTEDTAPRAALLPQENTETTTTPTQKPTLFPPPLTRSPSQRGLFQRSHSLATSDIIADENYEFVNPFDDESFLFDSFNSNSNFINERNQSDSTSSTVNSYGIFGTKLLKPGVIRETSVSSTSSDLAGYGALIGDKVTPTCYMNSDVGSPHVVPVRSSSIGSVSTADKEEVNERANTSFLVDAHDNEDDTRSIASEATIGLPLWDWFNRDESNKSRTFLLSSSTKTTNNIVPTNPTTCTSNTIVSSKIQKEHHDTSSISN